MDGHPWRETDYLDDKRFTVALPPWYCLRSHYSLAYHVKCLAVRTTFKEQIWSLWVRTIRTPVRRPADLACSGLLLAVLYHSLVSFADLGKDSYHLRSLLTSCNHELNSARVCLRWLGLLMFGFLSFRLIPGKGISAEWIGQASLGNQQWFRKPYIVARAEDLRLPLSPCEKRQRKRAENWRDPGRFVERKEEECDYRVGFEKGEGVVREFERGTEKGQYCTPEKWTNWPFVWIFGVTESYAKSCHRLNK